MNSPLTSSNHHRIPGRNPWFYMILWLMLKKNMFKKNEITFFWIIFFPQVYHSNHHLSHGIKKKIPFHSHHFCCCFLSAKSPNLKKSMKKNRRNFESPAGPGTFAQDRHPGW